ncbi:MAG: NAD(P)H-binding protein [Hyphomicrobium sp.]|jgi:uncharacterized protein YbjT (DUF2867 family)
MRPIKRIAMIGATGMLGQPVAAALVKAGFEVTALARDVERARRLLPPGVEVVEADLRDEESLRAGLHGQDALYLNLSVAPGERACDLHSEAQGLDHVLGAAREANIARIGYVSALIHDTDRSQWWVIDLWRSALARIKASGIPYTIFYPSNFMETLAQRHSAGSLFVMLGRARYSNYWIAGSEFGGQVAAAFASPGGANREYVIQGPEPLTYDEAVQRYVRALNNSTFVVRLPLWLVHMGGAFSRELDFNARIMQAVLDYPEEFKASSTWAELGKPKTSIEGFVAQQRAIAA